MEITSRDNSKVKLIRSLRMRKHRQATGLFLVEGIRHVGEAVDASREQGAHWLEFICYSPELLTSAYARELIQQQEQVGIPVYALPAEILASLAEKENPQGIIAVARRKSLELEDLTAKEFPWPVALVSPQDPGNIGSILRTIDAVGASCLVLLDGAADPFQPGAVRASMGSIFWYPVVETSFKQFIHWVRREGYTLYGTSAHASVDYRTVLKYNLPLVLLMGSEREGLTSTQAQSCDTLLRLPMKGRATSLNLAIAAGIMLYSIFEKVDS
jgi:TrmH family RNA methyltransferase